MPLPTTDVPMGQASAVRLLAPESKDAVKGLGWEDKSEKANIQDIRHQVVYVSTFKEIFQATPP